VRGDDGSQTLQIDFSLAGGRFGFIDGEGNGCVDVLADNFGAGLAADRDLGRAGSGLPDLRREGCLPFEAPTEPTQLRSGKISRRSLVPRR